MLILPIEAASRKKQLIDVDAVICVGVKENTDFLMGKPWSRLERLILIDTMEIFGKESTLERQRSLSKESTQSVPECFKNLTKHIWENTDQEDQGPLIEEVKDNDNDTELIEILNEAMVGGKK